MRPAQRTLAAALPTAAAGMRMVSATVVNPGGSNGVGVRHALTLSDSFDRPDSPSLGSTDGGNDGPKPWQVTTYPKVWNPSFGNTPGWMGRFPAPAGASTPVGHSAPWGIRDGHAVDANPDKAPIADVQEDQPPIPQTASGSLALLYPDIGDTSLKWQAGSVTSLSMTYASDGDTNTAAQTADQTWRQQELQEVDTVGLVWSAAISQVSPTLFEGSGYWAGWTGTSWQRMSVGSPTSRDSALLTGDVYQNLTPGGPAPVKGDVLTVTFSYVNGGNTLLESFALNGTPLGTYWNFTPGMTTLGAVGLKSEPAPDRPRTKIAAFSFTGLSPLVYTTGDVTVDFGDGVPVAVPRRAACSALAVGDTVLVHRQAHSAVLMDRIVPAGSS